MLFSIAVIFLVLLIIFQIGKISEYVGILRGEKKSQQQSNKVNANLMIGFLVLGLIGCYLCNQYLYPKTHLQYGSSSVEGEKVDNMLWVTIAITGAVFIITQVLLFYFAWKYQAREGGVAYFYPHNTKLEFIWTTVPTIVLLILIVIGLRAWALFTGDAPANAQQIEITGKQFSWIFRYPGKDGVFGKKYFKNIDESASNPLGQVWKDSAALGQKADPANFDDVVTEATCYVVVNKPVKLIINSRDVIHDVGLAFFRMKMDAVPGTPTTLWFTPKYTTEEMKKRTGNPNFAYEISCDQLCGRGHYSMRGVIVVVTQAEYDQWMASQKPKYVQAVLEAAPATNAQPASGAAADSTAQTVKI